MSVPSQRWRLIQAEEIVKLLASVLRNLSMYPTNHPIVASSCKRLADKVEEATTPEQDSWTLVLIGGEFIYEKVPLHKISLLVRPLIRSLANRRIESLTLRRSVTPEELAAFFNLLISDEDVWTRGGDLDGDLASKGLKNIALKRVKLSQEIEAGSTNTDEARDIYGSMRLALTRFFISLFDKASNPSLDLVRVLVERMINAMVNDRFAMVSRLHTRHHPNDLVAHSINTAIISYVVAEQIGAHVDMLQDIIISALLHDIGLMDIPPKVENGVLMSSEDQRIYLEHPIRAVGILRSIPSAPQLAEVVAFEHHLQADGKGFPKIKSFDGLNPASCIVDLASTYDKILQSEQYTPPEEVPRRMIRLAGVEFDPAVLAHFLIALGVYPPGTYVKLTTEDIALVLESNRGDVFRPLVKLLFTSDNDEYLEDKVLDLTERDPATGQYIASIVESVQPSKLPL